MKYLILLTLLVSCANKVEVPSHVDHSGTITTVNTIRIEIAIPDMMTKAFTDTCNNKCKNEPTCVTACIAQAQQDYTTALINLIAQYNNTTTPATAGVGQ